MVKIILSLLSNFEYIEESYIVLSTGKWLFFYWLVLWILKLTSFSTIESVSPTMT